MKRSTQIILGSVIALLIVSVISSAALSNYRANRIDSILNPKPSASADDGIVTIDKMVVTILNGTNREGLGTRLASRLETFGVFVTKIDNYKKRNMNLPPSLLVMTYLNHSLNKLIQLEPSPK